MTNRLGLLSVWMLGLTSLVAAESAALSAGQLAGIRIAALKGTATVNLPGGEKYAATIGELVPPGAIIATGRGAALDLFLSNEAGTLRLTENTRIGLTMAETNEQGIYSHIEFHLQAGTALGMGNRLPLTSRYRFRISNGFIDTLGRHFRIGYDGFVVAMDGSLLFAHTPQGGTPELHELNAPDPVYFWPGQGVKPAPPALQAEIKAQSETRLPTR